MNDLKDIIEVSINVLSKMGIEKYDFRYYNEYALCAIWLKGEQDGH